MGDKQLFIFDIDSALDKLEDDLISSEITTISTPQNQQQKINKDEEISIKLSDKIGNDAGENNGNDVKDTSANEPLSESILDSEYREIIERNIKSEKICGERPKKI